MLGIAAFGDYFPLEFADFDQLARATHRSALSHNIMTKQE
jgi:hypothetical protein